MKEKYEKPKMTIVEIEDLDIITSSAAINNNPVSTPDPGWIPGWY